MENEVDVTILPRTEDLEAWLVWLVPVIFLMLWDVWKAWKRRAFWIPGQALVLSALIIQLLSFIDYKHISVYSGSGYQSEKVEVILVKNQLVIDGGRLMMCVLIAYFLPGMARSGSITDGSNLAALALSITFHVVSEVRSFWIVEKRNKSLRAAAALPDVILSFLCKITLILVIIFLLVLLIRATMIGRSIRRIMSQKIPSALSCTPRNETKEHVLKCWIAARLSQPDYVLVRSGLRSWVFPTVTFCIGVHVIKWIYESLNDHESLNSVTKRTLVQFVSGGQFVIVVIGWIVLLLGWVTSLMYGDISSGDFKKMGIEDALTDLTAYLIRLSVRDKRIQEKTIREMKKIRGLKSLCCTGLWVLKLFQMENLRSLWRLFFKSFSRAVRHDDQFTMYQETLEKLLIEGENPQSLWKANQPGFREVESYMDQGREDGMRSPSQLIELLRLGAVTATGEAVTATEEEVHLQQSWKMTAVSFIRIMICYDNGSNDSVIEDTMQCYIQAWEYMNFVDGLNEEVKSLGRQADEEFDSLQDRWNESEQPGMLNEKMKPLLIALIQQWESYTPEYRSNLQKSSDLTEVANYWLFETWRLMKISDPRTTISAHRIKDELAKAYFLYMKSGLKKAVLEKCRKLAEEGMEEEILDVAFLSAKAQGVLDKVREGHNTDQRSTSSPIAPVLVKVGQGNDGGNRPETRCNTDQASTSSTIPPVNEEVGEDNGQAELQNNTDWQSTRYRGHYESSDNEDEDEDEDGHWDKQKIL